MLALPLSSWDLLIRQARLTGLLAHLFDTAKQLNNPVIPSQPIHHMQSARTLTDKHQRDVRWEVYCILEALKEVECPTILLKGAAYLMADLPPARSRFFSDIDILVPKGIIDQVEQTLRLKGWVTSTTNAYDQRYFRTWMHEIPPLHHRFRNTTLDVHHNILPLTAKLRPNPEKLIKDAIPVSGYNKLYVLSPTDMILHSATHLFSDGELEHGLRDLVDLDCLFRHFGKQEKFWDKLLNRAIEQDLGRPLYYALRYTNKILKTPVPFEILDKSNTLAPRFPEGMDKLFSRALLPDHPSCGDQFTKSARGLLYIRSHYLRMPAHLLVPHLIRKATRKNES